LGAPTSCNHLPFALERPERVGDDELIHRLPKAQADGGMQLRLTPGELIERLAALTLPARIDRHRYHGEPTPNAPLRA
jgi:hypothetical protein